MYLVNICVDNAEIGILQSKDYTVFSCNTCFSNILFYNSILFYLYPASPLISESFLKLTFPSCLSKASTRAETGLRPTLKNTVPNPYETANTLDLLNISCPFKLIYVEISPLV